MPAKYAFATTGTTPIVGPNEELGNISGIAASSAVLNLTIYDLHQSALKSQILAAMSVEYSIVSIANWVYPFLSQPGRSTLLVHNVSHEEVDTIVQNSTNESLAANVNTGLSKLIYPTVPSRASEE